MKYFLIIIVLIVLWTIWGYVSSRVEQAEYSVLKKGDGYEIREYAAHIEAQAIVNGSYDQALNEGFRIIAGYIFGGNVKKESIAMTAPVREEKLSSENIAMTAPVLSKSDGDSRVIAFVMPKKYSLETLPTPSDARVQLVEVPVRKVAVLQFSWYRSSSLVQKKETELLAALSRDNIEITGSPSYAGYNAPWTPPWMVRNEVMVEVR